MIDNSSYNVAIAMRSITSSMAMDDEYGVEIEATLHVGGGHDGWNDCVEEQGESSGGFSCGDLLSIL